MADIVTFWLDNKQSCGTRATQLGDQLLVSYREKFYVVVNGAALMKGGKPLRFSPTTLPTAWKKVLRGDLPPGDLPISAELNIPLKSAVARKAGVQKEKETAVMSEPIAIAAEAGIPAVQSKQTVPKVAKVTSKTEVKQSAQVAVAADCPYCNQKHEIPVEKGRSGKPFFCTCTKCQSDFAVRFVQVTMYQAQVAGFR